MIKLQMDLKVEGTVALYPRFKIQCIHILQIISNGFIKKTRGENSENKTTKTTLVFTF